MTTPPDLTPAISRLAAARYRAQGRPRRLALSALGRLSAGAFAVDRRAFEFAARIERPR